MSKGPSIKVRLILYPILLIVFAFSSYIITLLARGYNVSFENWEIVKEKTGTIIVATRPGDASVFVNGVLQKSRTPNLNFMSIQVKRLSPGNHTVRLEKDEYETWEGDIEVAPGLVTWVNLVLLLPKERKPEPFNLPFNAETLISSQDQKHLLVGTSDEASGVITYWNIETQTKQKRKILERALGPEETWSPVSYSENGQRILFEQKISDIKNIYVYENKEDPSFWNITEIFKLPFDYYVFNPKTNSELYAFREDDLYRLDYITRSVSAVIEENILSGFVTGGLFHVVQKENEINSLYRYNGSNQKTLIIKNLPISDTYTIKYLGGNSGYSVLARGSKTLYHYQGPVDPYAKIGKLVSEGVDSTIPSPKGQYVGFMRGVDFLSYEIDKDRFFPILTGKDGARISWFSDQFNIAFSHENKVKMVTVGGFYENILFENPFETAVVASSDGPRVFFISVTQDNKKRDLFVFDYN